MEHTLTIPERKKRTYIAEDFDGSTLQNIEPYYNELLAREINSLATLNKWLIDWNELDAVLGEQSRWTYVKTTVDTSDEVAKAALMNEYTVIFPTLTVLDNLLKKKFIASEFTALLDQNLFFTTLRKTKNALALFREENIALSSALQVKQSKYDEISGAQSIVYKGKEITMPQAAVYFEHTDRAVRQEVFELLQTRKLQDSETLDTLLTELIQIRHQIALNAGFKNYLEYRFAELDRFDYTPEDCLQFHTSGEEVIMPIVNQLYLQRKHDLGLEVLKPWDKDVDTSGKEPLKPFENSDELIEKTIACFNKIDPYFAERIEIMREMKYLDLDSRMNKGAGGYNITMPEIGVPFIFMNSANSESDVITMVHEGGHAIHTFLSHSLPLNIFKDTTSEIAEVASMGMELMSLEHWDVFYTDADDLNRAKKNHLEYILSILTKTSLGDSFQFWLYLNPTHTVQERKNKWIELQGRFTTKHIDYTGYEEIQASGYQNILHFYVVPFYYIEYAFAELGAIALWRNYKQDSSKAVSDYKRALQLGYTGTIPVFYQTAGAKFDFSKAYISSLVDFLKQELDKL